MTHMLKSPEKQTKLSAAQILAGLTNVVVVLCGLFALGAMLFAPAHLNSLLLRASFFTAVGASVLSIVAHLAMWLWKKYDPQQTHAFRHWLSAHTASVAGFLGANWIWFHPPGLQ